MSTAITQQHTEGRWLALAAALLGWMFDGFEMGLFPLVVRPAIFDLLGTRHDGPVGKWMAVTTACFLVGAASGGVLFGWLGDRLGRVRAMGLSVVVYALFTGLCAVARSPQQIAALRFVSALGMGGEWSLGVALVMEIWPDKSRTFLAGLIGAAANVGFLFAFLMGRLLVEAPWRLLIGLGAAPGLLAVFILLAVPESQRWQEQHRKGTTSHWNPWDLAGVCIGVISILGLIYLWAAELDMTWRIAGSVLALAVTTAGFLFPVFRYLQRLGASEMRGHSGARPILMMLLGAGLSGVPLIVTWASNQWGPIWAEQLAGKTMSAVEASAAKASTGICGAAGAIVGTLAAAMLGTLVGRRISYFFLCLGGMASILIFFQLNEEFGAMFLVWAFVAGMMTASFYGWLPLYLPELFHSGMRATGQGFSYNFGRVLAAVGALQTGYLMNSVFEDSYPRACSIVSLVYLAGMALIWLAPETRGKPLPD